MATISTANYYERLAWIAWSLPLDVLWRLVKLAESGLTPSPTATISTANYYERLAWIEHAIGPIHEPHDRRECVSHDVPLYVCCFCSGFSTRGIRCARVLTIPSSESVICFWCNGYLYLYYKWKSRSTQRCDARPYKRNVAANSLRYWVGINVFSNTVRSRGVIPEKRRTG